MGWRLGVFWSMHSMYTDRRYGTVVTGIEQTTRNYEVPSTESKAIRTGTRHLMRWFVMLSGSGSL